MTDAVAANLEPNRPYSFAAFAIGLAGLAARPDVVTVGGADVTVSVNTSRIVYGEEAVLKGRIRDVVTGQPLEYADFQVLAHRPGTGEEFLAVGQDFTRGGGNFSFPVAAPETYEFVVVFLGDGSHLGGFASSRVVSVAFSVYAKPVEKAGRIGTTFTIVVGVDPIAKAKPIVVEELVKGKWKKVTTVKLSTKSIAKVKVKPKTKGTHTYRVYKAKDATHVAGTSKSVKIKVT